MPLETGGLEMVMASRQGSYLSYLLRLWLVEGDGPVWRASLENPSTAERRGFATLEQLVAFLRAETDDLAAEEGREPEAESAGPLRVDQPSIDCRIDC